MIIFCGELSRWYLSSGELFALLISLSAVLGHNLGTEFGGGGGGGGREEGGGLLQYLQNIQVALQEEMSSKVLHHG